MILVIKVGYQTTVQHYPSLEMYMLYVGINLDGVPQNVMIIVTGRRLQCRQYLVKKTRNQAAFTQILSLPSLSELRA